MQYAAKTAHAVDKVLATFTIMVKMDLHIRYPIANHFRKWFQECRMIFFFWKKEGISRCVADRIRLRSPRNLWPSRPPSSDTPLRGP